MTGRVLVIGNKNYSSWSLRPWLALKAAGVEFREEMIWLDQEDTAKNIAAHSGAGKVPVLHDGNVTIWESLAICEYVAETWPDSTLWPDDRAARAYARSIAAEMHASFGPLRSNCPMDLRTRTQLELDAPTQRDVDRVCHLWNTARERYGATGPYLFGHFTIADCMYAPVATRFVTYGVTVDEVSATYRDAIMNHPHMLEWIAATEGEPVLPDH